MDINSSAFFFAFLDGNIDVGLGIVQFSLGAPMSPTFPDEVRTFHLSRDIDDLFSNDAIIFVRENGQLHTFLFFAAPESINFCEALKAVPSSIPNSSERSLT